MSSPPNFAENGALQIGSIDSSVQIADEDEMLHSNTPNRLALSSKLALNINSAGLSVRDDGRDDKRKLQYI